MNFNEYLSLTKENVITINCVEYPDGIGSTSGFSILNLISSLFQIKDIICFIIDVLRILFVLVCPFWIIKRKYGYNTGKLSDILLTKSIKLNKNQYAVKMYHDLANGITNITTELPILNITPREKIENSVLIHPGVSKISVQKGMIKTINAEKWAEVIEELANKGKKVFLIGGPDDSECIEKITQMVQPEKFENLYGTTKNLKDLAESL